MTITAVHLMRPGDTDSTAAVTYGRGWVCPFCHRSLGDADGAGAPKPGRRCDCGVCVVEVERI
jgi:hypothetical protein